MEPGGRVSQLIAVSSLEKSGPSRRPRLLSSCRDILEFVEGLNSVTIRVAGDAHLQPRLQSPY